MSSSNDSAFGAESGTGTGSGGLGSEILVAAIVFFAMAVVFVVFIYIYVRWNWGPGSEARRAHLHRVLFGHGPDADAPPARPRGLDPAVLEKLPVSLHATSEGALECAVCLSEVSDGEKVRVLPKCKHGFHVQCIDMWLHSHSTCPLCRDPLAGEHCGGVSTEGYTSGAPALPTDVMFWGTEDRVLTTATREPAVQQLVIDIPRRAMEETPATTSSAASPPLPASSGGATPSLGRLRSFTRLFSMGRWAAAAGTSREGDVEQGEAATAGGKTPRQS